MGFLLPIIGFGIGSAFGFGAWGALIGGFLQQVFFPPEGPKGPRLNELNVQHSTVGAPIPIVYGTAALAGNVIWSGGLIETKHEDEQGGKFGIGGTKTTSYTYSVDVAVGICEGEITGIRRIWADADLIYDASDDETLLARIVAGDQAAADQIGQLIFDALRGIRAMSAQLNFTLYTGTEDQLPDPTIEGYVGDVSAYRGLAYIVFNDFQLEKYGNRIPNFRFEVYSGAATECGLYSAGQLYPWLFDPASADANPGQYNPNTNDPRNPLNTHLYANCIGSMTGASDSLATAKASMSAAYSGRIFLIDDAVGPDIGDNIFIQGWGTSSTPNDFRPCDDTPGNADYVTLALNVNSIHISPNERFGCTGLDGPAAQDICDGVFAGAMAGSHGGQASGFYARTNNNDSAAAAGLFEGITTAQGVDGFGDCAPPEPIQKWRLLDQQICVARSIQPASPCAFGTPLSGAPGWCVFNGQIAQDITWTEVAGTFKALQRYDDTGGLPGTVSAYPVNPTLRNDDPNYSNQAYWEAAYAGALAAGEPIAAGLTYGVDYPQVQSFAYFSECDTVDTECVPMAIIVADICRRAGLRTDTATQIDVSGLTTCVTGYIIGRQMSAREALGPLRMFGLWDAVETNALLKFVERGAAIVDTLTADDLGAHENGSQPPTAMEVSRLQEKDIPRRLRLHFANFLHDHEVSEQAASRITTEAVDEMDVELPISMEPDTAKQLAEIMLYAQWVGRDTFRFSLDNNWLKLEPSDCIELPVDGQTERVRILAVNYKIGGILDIEGQRDDDGSYISTAVATPSQPSGGGLGGPGSGPICPSGLVLLDIPRLNNAHIDAGYYAAIYSTCPAADSWACAELYRSNDGGITYGRVARTNDETTVGEIVTITGPATDPTLPGESPAYDTTTSITVTLFQGELESITDAQIAAGQNTAAIGIDGRWVIIQYKTATFDTGDTWVLTDLIWGVNGTQHLLYTTVAGDTFVLLSDSALLRIAESADAIGVEKQFKAVTCGESVDAVTAVDFTTWGLSYLRLCPSTVISATVTDPPVSPSDGDAYLLPNDTSLTDEWADHGGEIAHWSDETDSWVFCTPVPGTIVTIGVDSSSDPGDDSVISDGAGNYNPAPWTPAIPPLAIATPIDTDYFVFHDGTGYKKGLLAEISGGGFPTTDTSDIGIALDELTDVIITAPAPGEVLTYDSSGWHNEAPTGGGGSLEHIAEQVVTGSAAASITVSGLDLDTDKIYYVIIALKNATAGGAAVLLTYNSDTTATNYWVDNQSNGSATQSNTATIGSLGASTTAQLLGHGIISRPVTRVSANWTQALGGTSTGLVRALQNSHLWTTTATNVTSFTLTAGSGIIDIGSRVNVWRLTPP